MSRGKGRVRVTVIHWAVLAATALFALPALAADPDHDGDGATTGDCRPLDPNFHPSATDHPDLAFEDLNCDGIDGDKANAYFVQPSGSDGNVGTSNAPFQTIQRGIDAARTSGTKAVYVATGTYNQRLSFPADADGVRIHGGYEAGTWQRTTSTVTVVNGQPETAFLDGARDVVVQLVTLNGTRGGGSLSAYGVRAVNNSEIALIRAATSAGAGGTGTTGGGGSTPAKAANGAAGHTQVVPQGQGGTPCDYAGVGGSSSQPGNGFDGGSGGTGGEETNDGENGVSGSEGGGGSPGGDGGPGGTDLAGTADNPAETENGKTGGAGATGAQGAHGSGGAGDTGAAGATWVGRSGTDGANGGPGYGGGGGGGGAGDGAPGGWSSGAGGGQGGDGGAGGGRGTRGDWGGGSFGLYLHNSQATVVDGSAVQAGAGGAGGDGGSGASGGAGGDGGPGGTTFDCPNKEGGHGGAGGAGGQGGPGGSGGGGSGGPSIGVARLGTSLATVDGDSTAAAATPGAGGTGPGDAGDGATGASGAMVPAGSPATDFDDDGITDAGDACVEVHRGTDANGDGCPDRAAALGDADGDGIPDGTDACPSTPAGTGDANGDGCPDSTGGGTGTGTGTGGGSGGGAILVVTAPRLTYFKAARRQRPLRARALRFTASCSEACRLTAVAKLRRSTLGKTTRSLATGTPTGLRLRLSKRGLSVLRKALRRQRSAKISVTFTLRDAAGNVGPASRRLSVAR